MAIYPCDFDRHRYPGPQRTAYPALVNGTTTDRRKLRLCKTHFDDLVQLLESFMFDADHPYVPSGCAQCDDPSPDHAAYVTLYDYGAERRDLYAPLCTRHAGDWLMPFKIAL